MQFQAKLKQNKKSKSTYRKMLKGQEFTEKRMFNKEGKLC